MIIAMARKEKIKAMINSDLEKLLIQVGDYDDFLEGLIVCHHCGKVINHDNLAMIIPVKNNESIKLRYICDNRECIKSV